MIMALMALSVLLLLTVATLIFATLAINPATMLRLLTRLYGFDYSGAVLSQYRLVGILGIVWLAYMLWVHRW
jgi:hypothetical protein